MTQDQVAGHCRSVHAALAHCRGLCHVAAYAGGGSPYLVAYAEGDCGPPWVPVLDCGGLPVYCQRSGSISGPRPG